MFEIIEIGRLSRRRFFRRPQQLRQVKLKAVKDTFCEKLGKHYEGRGRYSVRTYRADFSEGTVITVWFASTDLIALGDKVSVETLAGQGYLNQFFRMTDSKG